MLSATQRATIREAMVYPTRYRQDFAPSNDIENALDRVDALTTSGDSTVETKLIAAIAEYNASKALLQVNPTAAMVRQAGKTTISWAQYVEQVKDRGRRAVRLMATELSPVPPLGDVFSPVSPFANGGNGLRYG